jgi:hypothetical protein
MFPKSKRKTKDSTWRDYRLLIGLIVLWLMFVQFILWFDPVMLRLAPTGNAIPYEAQLEYLINVGFVSIWMLVAYWFGHRNGFSRYWIFICVSGALIAMLMLAIENNAPNYPPDCVYRQLANSFVWVRARFSCTNYLLF